jgi:hypothetical protein
VGPSIQLFYNDYLQTWEIATKRDIGGYSMEPGYQQTFRERFIQYFKSITQKEDINEIFQTWDSSLSYQFIMARDTLVLVSVFHGYIYVPHFTLFSWLRMVNIPRYVTVDTEEELQHYYGSCSSNHLTRGVIVVSNETGEKVKLENPAYHQHSICANYPKSHLFQYLCFRRINQIDAFLRNTPVPMKNIVTEYEKQLAFHFHALYIACLHPRWSVSSKYIKHVDYIYTFDSMIDENLVREYFYSLSPVDLLCFFM